MNCDCPFCKSNYYSINSDDSYDQYYNINPYPYFVNPDVEDRAMKKINKILDDLTPCDKKDWGLKRNPRWYYRNPNYYW